MDALPRTLAVCADDFGLTLGISTGIAQLAHAGRLNAVSCMPQAPAWADSLPLLAALPKTVERGLHFNLIEGQPLSAELRRYWPRYPSQPRLILAAHLRRLPLLALAHEFYAQWQAFAQATGAAPQFVDGHLHMHHLPGVWEIVLGAVSAAAAPPAVRATGRVLGPGEGVKRRLIEATGGRALQRALLQRGMRHNPSLIGVYNFVDTDYGARIRRWLVTLPAEGGLLFCHPGVAGPAHGVVDPIAPARLREQAYFSSAAFPQDLAEANVVLGSVWGS
ncbi:ChbG/HpnK family deacetylase [Rhodoferax sp.]|uniref:ChbG/HpnK family deacetylase n=1 Tax=Rhodoferax sp. TaxID=50421 RepID=UPI00374DC939